MRYMNINNCHGLSAKAQKELKTGIKPTIIHRMYRNKNASGIRSLAFFHSTYISQAPNIS